MTWTIYHKIRRLCVINDVDHMQQVTGTLYNKFSSVQSLDRLDRRRGHKGRFSRDPPPVFPAGGPCEQFWHGQGCPLFGFVHQAFSLPTTALSSLQGALRMVLEKLSWHVTCPNHASFRLLTVARRGSCGPTRKLLRTQSLVLCSK